MTITKTDIDKWIERGTMRKLKARIALFFVKFGIMIYESEPAFMYNEEDVDNLTRLWKYHDEFQVVVNESR